MRGFVVIRYTLIGLSLLLMAAWLLLLPVEDVDAMMIWCYVLLGVAVVLIIILPAIGLVRNPGHAKRILIGLGVVAIIGLAGWLLSSATPVANPAGGLFDNATTLRLSDMGLYMTYAALAAAVGVAVYFEIRKNLK